MASTNKTVNYEFGQFVGTDKPSWLTDYNGDMIKIDLAIKTIEDLITGVNSQIDYITETEILTKANKENPIITGVMDLQGGQIKFPSTQVPSSDPNTLDDYEEGTFTPTTSTAGLSVTTIAFAKYIKIGKFVSGMIYVDFNNTSGSEINNLVVGGLPFTSDGWGFSRKVIGLNASGAGCYIENGGNLIYISSDNIPTGSSSNMYYFTYISTQ